MANPKLYHTTAPRQKSEALSWERLRLAGFTPQPACANVRHRYPQIVLRNLPQGKKTDYDPCRLLKNELVSEITKSASTAMHRITTITLLALPTLYYVAREGPITCFTFSITYARILLGRV
jgi:hypothetical protein